MLSCKMLLCVVLVALVGAILPSVQASERRTPRVALLFASRGEMPLEPVWTQFLKSVEGLRPPALSDQQWKEVMEDERVEGIKRRLHEVGRFTPNSILQNRSCADNVVIKEAAETLANSWENTDPNAPLPRRGAKLRNPDAVPHPVYASQELYSVYVHVPPEFDSYPESSVFHGREITPSTNAERFRHSLGMMSLLLLEAALHDEQVPNARFAIISEADAPMYNAGAMYLQLMLSHRSRIGPTYSFEELLHVDSESSAVSPLMFVDPFTKDHFTKTTQWVSLTRAAAVAAVHDRIVEPWFATFAGSRWRCRFIEEARQIFPELEKLVQKGVNLRTRHAAMQLRRNNALPPNFTQGELLEGLLPAPRDVSQHGATKESGQISASSVPFWASGLRSIFSRGQGTKSQQQESPLLSLTPVQKAALDSYRRELKIQPPTWAYMPFDLSKWGPEFQATSVLPSRSRRDAGGLLQESGPVIDPTVEAQERDRIWNSLLGGRSTVAESRRRLAEAVVTSPEHSDDEIEGWGFEYEYSYNSMFYSDSQYDDMPSYDMYAGHAHDDDDGVLEASAKLPEVLSAPGRRLSAPEGLEMARARRQAARNGGTKVKSMVIEREMKRLEAQAEADDKKEQDKREDIMLRHNKASEYVQGRLTQRSGVFAHRTSMKRGISIYDLLRERVSINKTIDRPYNIDWPLPFCAWCNGNPARDPWEHWSMDQQMDFLFHIFPGAASRVVNIVSDECMVKSMMNFYGIKGQEWQTDAFSSHVDWSRANNGGHPGVYSQLMLQVDPDFIRRMVRQTHCDSQALTVYRSAGELFAGAASHVPEGENATAPLAQVWPHTTLQDQCVLFARKFLPGTGKESETFFGPCTQVGLDPHCLHPHGLEGMVSGSSSHP